MPVVTVIDDPDFSLADFAHVVNRLKVMAKLDPVQYKHPVEGLIEVNVRGDPVDVCVHFDDRCADPYCEITMKRESA